MKTIKWFVAGIQVWRTTIELNTPSHDTINVESWSKGESIRIAKKIKKLLETNTP